MEFALTAAFTPTRSHQHPDFTNANICCPFHDDQTPSGSIHQARDGSWLFTCHGGGGCAWNPKNNERLPSSTGDVFAVLIAAQRPAGKRLSFPAAYAALVAEQQTLGPNPFMASAASASSWTPPTAAPDAVAQANDEAYEATQALFEPGDPNFLVNLWVTRAISSDTATRYVLGIHRESGRIWWLFSIRHRHNCPNGSFVKGGFMVQKRHAADRRDDPKCMWSPAGAKVGNPAFPVCVEASRPGPVFICPGEFKALAVIDIGLNAIGITNGETVPTKAEVSIVPDGVVELLVDRPVAIVPDNDHTGRQWAVRMRTDLLKARIAATIVDLQQTHAGADITDWLVERRVSATTWSHSSATSRRNEMT